MADILIRKVDEATKELLRLRAERRGKSLEADLRDTLEKLAREEAESPDDTEPFGDWLVAISRLGFNLDAAPDLHRSAPVCTGLHRSAPARSAQLDSTVRYLGVEVEDALAIAESIDVERGASPDWDRAPASRLRQTRSNPSAKLGIVQHVF